ncbi:S-layer family protein [Mastigocoleus testarum]|uniref:Filamentous haemagglutinin FhaB/tRNA nuclease CdiA-like TPS domain-containing protein n=1 Tax=Mastigocoleus testarum BC008 TaxID=371196 RepID=A0A0V7ZY98_9CYAN|nr:S-layer family protein [Mastigocoleus testarum]KST69493.1 hypothetical protein BC008_04125 [Mastigocoleus testarum BC008]KST69541.1 hypothetical protein BC008_04365 [Mastigocoleus testarum BC008]
MEITGINSFATSISTASVGAATGNGGNIIINTESLRVNNLARINVSGSDGGGAGNITINADRINLSDQGRIEAQAAAGNRGDIQLNAQFLELHNNSRITTNATNTAHGGNITINSPIIIGLENSDIIANAVEGNGGNIDITTQGIFGLQFRSRLTPESDITASSKFGVNGTVDINNFGVDPSIGIVELPTALVDSSQEMAKGCSGTFDNSFIITGRGGIPQNPNGQVSINRPWSDIRNLSAYGQVSSKVATTNNQESSQKFNQESSQTLIVEASHLIRNSKGEIELIAPANFGNNKFNTVPTTCASVRRTVNNQ